jgi:hypothetical protein
VVEVQSKDFEHDVLRISQETISGTVDIGRTPAQVGVLLEIVGSASAPHCWKDLLEETFAAGSAQGTRVGHVTVAPLGAVDVGDHSGGLRVRVVTTSHGLSIPITIDIVAAQRGRTAVSVAITGFGATTTKGVERAVLQKMLDRLDAA